MSLKEVKIKRMAVEPSRRILVTSDIHGNLTHFKNVLEKAEFCDCDTLFIVGDIIEKGPESLSTLRFVKTLCEKGNTVALLGNVDAYKLNCIYNLSNENAESFYNHLLVFRNWYGSTFFDEMAAECGIEINSPEDILAAKSAVLSHFKPELDFLEELPTIVEAGSYIFVHGGLYYTELEKNREKTTFEITKYDSFMTQTPLSFEKYVITGHWPICLYGEKSHQLNPLINKEKKIIAIDGGCGVKRNGQLNLLIIPDINAPVDDISHIYCDSLPKFKAEVSQKGKPASLYISWVTRNIKVLEKGEEFSLVKHEKTGKELYVPTSHIINGNECIDYSDELLSIKRGDTLSLIAETSKGKIVKKDGVIGWYKA